MTSTDHTLTGPDPVDPRTTDQVAGHIDRLAELLYAALEQCGLEAELISAVQRCGDLAHLWARHQARQLPCAGTCQPVTWTTTLWICGAEDPVTGWVCARSEHGDTEAHVACSGDDHRQAVWYTHPSRSGSRPTPLGAGLPPAAREPADVDTSVGFRAATQPPVTTRKETDVNHLSDDVPDQRIGNHAGPYGHRPERDTEGSAGDPGCGDEGRVGRADHRGPGDRVGVDSLRGWRRGGPGGDREGGRPAEEAVRVAPTVVGRILACCGGLVGEHVADICPEIAAILDRDGPRYTTPLGDRRERPVPCAACGAGTAALDAVCDWCAVDRLNRKDEAA